MTNASLMPLSALRLWKAVKGRSPMGLWLNHGIPHKHPL